MAERRVPRIRFKGFEEDWEQRKLGEMGTTFTGLSGKTQDDFGHGEARFVTYMNVYMNTVSDPHLVDEVEIDLRQNSVRFGDVFFTTSSETPEEVGMTSVWLNNSDNIYLNSFCFGYRPTERVDSYYMAYMLRSDAIRKKITYLAQGISRYNISKKGVMQIEILLPDLTEQKLLGDYFREIDSLLSLHQRKLEKLKILKKAMLEKMFPKNGAKVPEIRFSGFTDDWEQRKLGELAFITTGKLDANAAKRDGEYKFFTCGKEILKTNSYAFDGEAILINGNGDLGYTRKYVGKFNAYQRTYVLQGFVMDYEYIEHAIHKFLPDKIKYESIGGAMPYIKIDSLMNLELTIPVVQEAVVVTRFLNELDSLLSLHQRKLEKLRQIKKSMLERMFV